MTCEWVYKRGERQSETVDSESSRSLRSGLHAEVRADRHVPGSFELVVDGTPQSHVDLGDPTHLFYEYVRRMGHVIDQLPAGPLTAVHLGAGALTLPRYIEATRPGSRQQVVELEPDLIELVREALPFPRGASIRIPLHCKENGKGYLEDRRPCSNIDPYTVARLLVETTCG